MDSDDKRRLPPGQTLTERFPVLHAGDVQRLDESKWKFTASGLVGNRMVLSLAEFMALPSTSIKADIHCVTRWSKYDTSWRGVSGKEIVSRCAPDPEVRFVLIQAPGWSTNLPLADLDRDDVLFAWEYDGKPITAEHGAPVRLVVPHLYFWKSAKWVTGIEFVKEDRPGFWENGGYHMRGDPWKEERYRDDPAWRRFKFW